MIAIHPTSLSARLAALLMIATLSACSGAEDNDPSEPDEMTTPDAGLMLDMTSTTPDQAPSFDMDAPDQSVTPEDLGTSDLDALDMASDLGSGDEDATMSEDMMPQQDMALPPDMSDELDMSTPDLSMPDMANPGLPDGPSSQRHTPKYIGTTPAENGYYEYLPPGYGDGAKRPLLVFWHGVGENGKGDQAELKNVLRNGPPLIIKDDEWPSSHPFVVLSPQHEGDNNCPSAAEIEKFVNYAVGAYDIDTKRVYVTGLSCGAIGLWKYLARDKGKVTAAAVPIAGNGKPPYDSVGCDLGLTAIWAFHGDADPKVNVSGTNYPVDHLLADCPSPPRKEVKKTIYPNVGHNSWARTYKIGGTHDIYSWLLSHSKP